MGDSECTMASFNTQLLLFACLAAWGYASPTEIPSEITQNAFKFPPEEIEILSPWSGLTIVINGWVLFFYCLWCWIVAPVHHVYLVFTSDRPRTKSPTVQVIARYVLFGVVYYALVATNVHGIQHCIGLLFSVVIFRSD